MRFASRSRDALGLHLVRAAEVPWEATEVTSLPGNYAGLIGLMNDQA